jgi:hypothetical protein
MSGVGWVVPDGALSLGFKEEGGPSIRLVTYPTQRDVVESKEPRGGWNGGDKVV